jgi:uncharacterized protein YdeI (YjbR/CyaY-like superfamily)
MQDRFEKVEIRSQAEWHQWLKQNHTQSESIWVVTFKKNRKDGGENHVPWVQIVEEAICFGWIDSRVAKLDDDRSMVLVSPRKPTSAWSRVNKDLVARLESEGRLQPAGLAKIGAAKANGLWNKLDEVENLTVPPDLAETLDQYPAAPAHWEAFPRSIKRGILEWILNAKTPETRARRISETARLAEKNVRANTPGAKKQ